jgi:protein-L-isoaspartate(D-aspartate) O-methyltransferase
MNPSLDTRYATARYHMVEGQLRPNKVTSAALVEAFGAVPRERFVPEAGRGFAYVDEAVPVAAGRYLLEPTVLARLLQEAQVQATDRVLVIGGSTGYAAAILAGMVASVVLVEEDEGMLATARTLVGDTASLTIRQGALTAGAPADGPFDLILIDGAVAEIPAAIDAQLAEGGRLVTVRVRSGNFGQAILRERTGGALSSRDLFDAGSPLLPGFAAKAGFVF